MKCATFFRGEKDVVGIVTFDLIGLLPTNHTLLFILQWHTEVYEKTLDINRKIAQPTQNIWNFIVIACIASVSSRGSSPSTFFAYALTFKRLLRRLSLSDSRVYKKWQPSAIIREIWDSNLETGRYGPKSGASRIIRESWLHSVIAKWTIVLYFIFSLFNSLLTIIDLVVF